jgi:hypothetical protein
MRECVGLLDFPDELLAAIGAHLPEDDEFAAALACARLRKAVASSARPSTSLARTSTSIGSVFRSLAKLQWAVSCGLPIDPQLARKAKCGPPEYLLLLLHVLPRTRLNLEGNQIGDAGTIGLGKALEVNATLTDLDLSYNQIGDAGAIALCKALDVNATLTMLFLWGITFGDASK